MINCGGRFGSGLGTGGLQSALIPGVLTSDELLVDVDVGSGLGARVIQLKQDRWLGVREILLSIDKHDSGDKALLVTDRVEVITGLGRPAVTGSRYHIW